MKWITLIDFSPDGKNNFPPERKKVILRIVNNTSNDNEIVYIGASWKKDEDNDKKVIWLGSDIYHLKANEGDLEITHWLDPEDITFPEDDLIGNRFEIMDI